MIARQDHTISAQDRNPASGFGALTGLVDNHGVKPTGAQKIRVQPSIRGAYHISTIQNLLNDIRLNRPRLAYGAGVSSPFPIPSPSPHPIVFLNRQDAKRAKVFSVPHCLIGNDFPGRQRISG